MDFKNTGNATDENLYIYKTEITPAQIFGCTILLVVFQLQVSMQG
jgi:hypothetical protein